MLQEALVPESAAEMSVSHAFIRLFFSTDQDN